MKKILLTLFILAFTLNTTNAWLWLIAQNWDLLNISKWNEMITKLNTKLDQSNITWTGNIEVNNSWTGVVISFTGWIESSPTPYISNTTQISIWSNSTSNIDLDWYNFTPTSVLQIPGFDWTVNSTTVLSPVSLQANITSWPATSDYNLVISNWWVLNTDWINNWVNLLHVWDILWTWVAWTYTEDFEAGLWSYVSSWLTGDWTRDSWWTPSGWTWPNEWAGGSTWYLYTEVSSGKHTNDFWIETSNFRHATSISLDYHMFWPDIWSLYIQTLFQWTRTTVWSISGQQQANQADAYINTWNIDLTWYQVESIRILMNWATSWSWDVAIDNISITSN